MGHHVCSLPLVSPPRACLLPQVDGVPFATPHPGTNRVTARTITLEGEGHGTCTPTESRHHLHSVLRQLR